MTQETMYIMGSDCSLALSPNLLKTIVSRLHQWASEENSLSCHLCPPWQLWFQLCIILCIGVVWGGVHMFKHFVYNPCVSIIHSPAQQGRLLKVEGYDLWGPRNHKLKAWETCTRHGSRERDFTHTHTKSLFWVPTCKMERAERYHQNPRMQSLPFT